MTLIHFYHYSHSSIHNLLFVLPYTVPPIFIITILKFIVNILHNYFEQYEWLYIFKLIILELCTVVTNVVILHDTLKWKHWTIVILKTPLPKPLQPSIEIYIFIYMTHYYTSLYIRHNFLLRRFSLVLLPLIKVVHIYFYIYICLLDNYSPCFLT